LFDKEFNQISDRLLGQGLELKAGPKEPHEGPLKVEVCLFSQNDVDEFKEYLDRLQGVLPMVEKGKRGRKKIAPASATFADDLMNMMDEHKDVDLVMKELVALEFVFTTLQLLEDLDINIALPEDTIDLVKKEFRVMIRMTKKAKNPMNNKYDPTLLILIKKDNPCYVSVYTFGEQQEVYQYEEGGEKEFKVPKSNLTKFPQFMIQEERNKFRMERDKLAANPEAKITRLYARYVHLVADENEGKGIVFPRIKEIERPY